MGPIDPGTFVPQPTPTVGVGVDPFGREDALPFLPEDIEPQWETATDERVMEAVRANDVIAYRSVRADGEHHIVALDLSTGEERWRQHEPGGSVLGLFEFDDRIVANIAVSPNVAITRAYDASTGAQLWDRDVELENLLPGQVGPYLIQSDFRTTPSSSVLWSVQDGTDLRRLQGRATSSDHWLDVQDDKILEIDPTTLEDQAIVALPADVDDDTWLSVTAHGVFTSRAGQVAVYDRNGAFRTMIETDAEWVDLWPLTNGGSRMLVSGEGSWVLTRTDDGPAAINSGRGWPVWIADTAGRTVLVVDVDEIRHDIIDATDGQTICSLHTPDGELSATRSGWWTDNTAYSLTCDRLWQVDPPADAVVHVIDGGLLVSEDSSFDGSGLVLMAQSTASGPQAIG